MSKTYINRIAKLDKIAAELDHHLSLSGECDRKGNTAYFLVRNSDGQNVRLEDEDGNPYSALLADDLEVALEWVAEQR